MWWLTPHGYSKEFCQSGKPIYKLDDDNCTNSIPVRNAFPILRFKSRSIAAIFLDENLRSLCQYLAVNLRTFSQRRSVKQKDYGRSLSKEISARIKDGTLFHRHDFTIQWL